MAVPTKNSKFIQKPFGIQRPYILHTGLSRGKVCMKHACSGT